MQKVISSNFVKGMVGMRKLNSTYFQFMGEHVPLCNNHKLNLKEQSPFIKRSFMMTIRVNLIEFGCRSF